METGQLNVNAPLGHQGRKLGGFVSFLRRSDAERAAKEMDGAEWGDSILRIGWGKSVPIASKALYGTGSLCFYRSRLKLIERGEVCRT